MVLYTKRKRAERKKMEDALERKKLKLEIANLKLANLYTVVKLFLTLMLGLTALLKLLQLSEVWFAALMS